MTITSFVAGATAALGAVTGEKKIPYDRVKEICQKVEGVTPPPPPLEQVLVGTLDAGTGTFTWGPGIVTKTDTGPLIKGVATGFTNIHVKVLVPNLDPAITSLGSLGTRINTGVLSNTLGGINAGAGATLHSAPAPAGGIGAASGAARAGGVAGGVVGGGGTTTSGGIFQKHYAAVRAAQVDMLIKVVNRPASAKISITADGRTSTADADQVDLIVPPRVWAEFTVNCAGKSFKDTLRFDRPPVIGCFTLEAFPATIVYEPPGSGSSQSYTTATTAGTTLETFTGTESSQSQPVDTPFSTVTDMISLLNTVGEAVAKVKPEVGQGMQTVSSVLSAAWGSSETDEDVTHSVSEKKTLSFSVSKSTTLSTNAHMGPGKGDVFYILIKPTFLWLAAQDDETGGVFITLSLLGYEGKASMSAEDLRRNTITPPSKEMQQLLLRQDPLASEYAGGAQGLGRPGLQIPTGLLSGAGSGASAAVRRGRFVPADPAFFTYAGSQMQQQYTRTVQQSDLTTTQTTDTVTTKETAGFLSYIAKNVPQDGEKHVRTVQGVSSGTSASQSTSDTVTYGAAVGEGYTLNIYYDNLYGTFAFTPAAAGTEQMVTGQVMQSGKPAANQLVALAGSDGLRSATKTDANGSFTVRTPLLQKGNFKVSVAGKDVPVNYTGKAIRGLKIDLGGVETAGAGAPAAAGAPAGAPPRGSGKPGGKISTSMPGVPGASEGSTATAIRGTPPPPPASAPANEAYTQETDPQLKGRLGRLAVRFPKDAPCNGTHVIVTKQGGGAAGTFYGSGQLDLLPGAYTVSISGKKVAAVNITPRNSCTITTGVLHIKAASGTHTEVLDTDRKTNLVSGYGDQQIGLPVGSYFVKVAGQSEAVEIKKDQVTEF